LLTSLLYQVTEGMTRLGLAAAGKV
jgi:hypothetical protein